MKITILTERDPQTGVLVAWVVDGAARGRNLLAGRKMRNPVLARMIIREALDRAVPGCEITWQGEGVSETRIDGD